MTKSIEPKPKILIVDDERFNINALVGLLGGSYQVMVAVNGEMAIKAAIKGQPDLILLDIVMPHMDGYEVLKRLKADPLTQDIPVIFITGRSTAEDESFGLEIGASDYISKPFHFGVVMARVKTQIRLKLQSDQLAAYAFKDGLTGLSNRRAFDDHLDREWARCLHLKCPIALILMDVDHFKLYNDHYGHTQGDECLKEISQILNSSVSTPSHLAARYGGEEFAVVLPELSLDQATQVAEQLRLLIETCQIPHEPSPVSEYVTASIGVTSVIPTAEVTIGHVVQKTDLCLYRSKESGRNQVTGESLR